MGHPTPDVEAIRGSFFDVAPVVREVPSARRG
jgi:hypothetical protein